MDEPANQILSQQLLTPYSDDDRAFKAAIYARTSSLNQKFGHSLDEQVRQCWERCKMLGWKITRIFKDEAESGDDTDRPQFQRMTATARGGHFDVVVFWKLDRFSRSILHAVELERELRKYDIALHSVTEQLDTSTPSGRFNFRNIASAAEFEREHIKERSQMGFKALALKHAWPNRTPPFGYNRMEDGTLEVDQEEAEIVQFIFERYCTLKSMPKVASELNDRGYETNGGNEWTARTVNKMLRNPIYCGRYSVAGVDDVVAAYRIVDESLFDGVTDIRHRFRRGNRESEPPMEERRKRRYAEDVLSIYRNFLEESSRLAVVS